MNNVNRWAIAAGICVVLAGVSGCSTNQTTGRKQLNVLSRDQEVTLAQALEHHRTRFRHAMLASWREEDMMLTQHRPQRVAHASPAVC